MLFGAPSWPLVLSFVLSLTGPSLHAMSCGGRMFHVVCFRIEWRREGWVGSWVGQSDEVLMNPLQCAQISATCQEGPGAAAWSLPSEVIWKRS